MELVGNLTGNAVVRTTEDGSKEFVTFSIALNKKYYSKGETKTKTTYVECSYWLNVGIAPYLTSGMLVFVSGDLMPARAYIKDGIAYASNQFFVDKVRLLNAAPKNRVQRVAETLVESSVAASEAADDLPF